MNTPYYLAHYLFGNAELYTTQARYALAQTSNDQALGVANQIDLKEIQFKAQLLAIELRAALGQADRAAATAEYTSLLGQWTEVSEQAAIYYQLWRLGGLDDNQSHAADLYRELYARMPNAEYRQRIRDLTGKPPPDPPALALPPEIVSQNAVNLDALLARVDALIDVGAAGQSRAVAK